MNFQTSPESETENIKKLYIYVVYILLFVQRKLVATAIAQPPQDIRLYWTSYILLRKMADKTRRNGQKKIHTHFYVLLPLIMMRTIQFECHNERINRRGMDIKRLKSKKKIKTRFTTTNAI